jgi:hypothetical protein
MVLALTARALGFAQFTLDEYRRWRSGDGYQVAWYLVPLLVLLALAAVVAIGAGIYCMARGLHLYAVINQGGKYLIGCR